MEGKNACYGAYNDTTQTGWGPAYQNSCIHSGSNEYSGGDTVWYDYVIATAGTITSENTTRENPANNATPSTESICPKGWTLPNKTQAQAIGNNTSTYVSSFSPVLGGSYIRGNINAKSTSGDWWTSVSVSANGASRYRLVYNGSVLQVGNGVRHAGRYIRCVPKS